MENLIQRIAKGAIKGIAPLLIPAMIGLGGCNRETVVITETYQGYHRDGSDNVYVFDSENREGRQTRKTNQFGQTQVTERDPTYRVLGDVKWKDSLEIGRTYGIGIKKGGLFADRIVSVKPVKMEDWNNIK